MASNLTTEILPEASYEEWEAFVSAGVGGSAYARTGYLDALCSADRGRFLVLAARQGEELVGGVALYEREKPWGRYVSPRVLLYYNGPVLASYDTRYPSRATSRQVKILSALEAAVGARGYGRAVLKALPSVQDVRPLLRGGWRVNLGYSYQVPLGPRSDMAERLDRSARRDVDRCFQKGLELDEEGDFDAFYRLHVATMERVGGRPYLPEASYRAFVERVRARGLAALFHARLPGGEPVATQLVLLGHPVTHTVCAGAAAEHLHLGASAWLRFRVFERLWEKGHEANDLTDAPLNDVGRFKSQLGGDLRPWYEMRSPSTRTFRWGQAAERAYWRTRGRAGRLVRRTLGTSG